MVYNGTYKYKKKRFVSVIGSTPTNPCSFSDNMTIDAQGPTVAFCRDFKLRLVFRWWGF